MHDGGREPPSAFYAMPEVAIEHALHWEAFHDLSSERQIGMGVGPLPYFALRHYVRELDMHGDEAEQFCEVLRLLDSEYLKLVGEQVKKTSKGGGKKQPDIEASVVDVPAQREILKNLASRAAAAAAGKRKKQ